MNPHFERRVSFLGQLLQHGFAEGRGSVPNRYFRDDDFREEGRTLDLGQFPRQPTDDVVLKHMSPIKTEENPTYEGIKPAHWYDVGLFVQGLDEVEHVIRVEHGQEG